MRRPAYLLGTTLLIAAALQLPEFKPSTESSQAKPSSETRFSSVPHIASPAPISTSIDSLLPAQPQRWVF
jgi:hypothetical protein